MIEMIRLVVVALMFVIGACSSNGSMDRTVVMVPCRDAMGLIAQVRCKAHNAKLAITVTSIQCVGREECAIEYDAVLCTLLAVAHVRKTLVGTLVGGAPLKYFICKTKKTGSQ